MQTDERSVLSKSLGRRSFLKASAAAVAAGAALQAPGMLAEAHADETGSIQQPEEVITPGTCRGGCGAGCQMNVHVRDGKIVKTSCRQQSDPNVTRICNKGITHALRVYGKERIKYPMKRVGERGEEKWEQISWDEAFDLIVSKWKEVENEYGATANAFLTAGGNISPDVNTGKRLCSAMGATMIDSAQDRVFYAAFPPMYGYNKGQGGGGRNDWFNSKHFFMWGFNPAESESQTFHYILQAQTDCGADITCIDVSYTTSASKSDHFVSIRPGTDGALALAMANVLVEKDLVDTEFLKTMTVAPLLVKDSDGKYLRLSDLGRAEAGTKEDKPVVMGEDGAIDALDAIANPLLLDVHDADGHAVKTAYELLLERVNEWTPEKASELCDVPVETIYELAYRLADGPTSVNIGLGLDHITNGVATFNAIVAATMMAGQFGRRGNSAKGSFRGEIAIGWNPFKLYTVPDAPKAPMFYAPAFLKCLDSGKYGDWDISNIKTLYVWNHNMLGIQVGTTKWYEFLEKIEFFVVADPVMTTTAKYADLVLPVCHYFECESCSGDDTRYVLHSAKAADPLYESKSDFEIFKELFKRMGLERYAFETVDDLYNAVFDDPVAKSIGLTWDRIKKEGSVLTFEPDDRVFGEEGVFSTPTGRLEFYHENISLDTNYGQEFDFYKERLPYWEPPMEAWHENPLAEKYPLVFISERSKFKVHTQYTYVPWLLELESEPYVTANPETCKERGIEDGDYVRLFNDRSSCTLRVRYNDGTRPGVIVIDHGWEKDQFVDGFYIDLLGYNVTPVVANSYYFDTLIQMEKADI
ncbi:molybdopterin-containing oxidoreductase family protein [Slackia piriformis]|uniref:molybdopterin-containing oxidoreductase family protein n=1 Tax=Slackia piriformis TaxID=626934 RepID=UPI0026DDABD6|nr:molybdopterin-dependent oxidoreductase [Slackia piriformis]MDO5023321.1 molybdopterin-dependent oxidoreductase [Slackia piriformis]